VEALYLMGVHPFLIFELARHGLFGLDRDEYLRRVRRAAASAGGGAGQG
jgi:hypothetical protein